MLCTWCTPWPETNRLPCPSRRRRTSVVLLLAEPDPSVVSTNQYYREAGILFVCLHHAVITHQIGLHDTKFCCQCILMRSPSEKQSFEELNVPRHLHVSVNKSLETEILLDPLLG